MSAYQSAFLWLGHTTLPHCESSHASFAHIYDNSGPVFVRGQYSCVLATSTSLLKQELWEQHAEYLFHVPPCTPSQFAQSITWVSREAQ
jgi:hypothetical protein